MKAALYARTSSQRQEEERTIESQIAEVESKIKSDGNILLPHCRYIDDGWSGMLLARPSLDALRDSVQHGEFEVLYVYDRGRIARKFAYQELILEELEDRQIKFISLHDSSGETPEEKVLQGMQGVFHEYERVKIAERMRRGKLYKAKNGIMPNGPAPYGYNFVQKTSTVAQHYEINDEEAVVVKQIFQWIGNEGYTFYKVIKNLHRLRILPRKKKREVWVKSSITRMLSQEAYIGTTFYNKKEAVAPKNPRVEEGYKRIKKSSRRIRPRSEWIPIKVPTILDLELFNKARMQAKLNFRKAKRNRKYEYTLTGKLFCYCGSPMCGDTVREHHYYRCSSRIKKYPLPNDCQVGGINVVNIETPIWDKLESLLSNPQLIREQAEKWLTKQADPHADERLKELEKFQKIILKIKEEELRHAKAYGEGIIELEAFRKLMSDIKLRKQAIENQMISLKLIQEKTVDKPNLSIDEICNSFPKVLEQLKSSTQRHIIELIVDCIKINKERSSATIRGYLPLQVNLSSAYESIGRNRRTAKCWQIYFV